jgi:radical SAM protein with 4Fe4S-binding SPASM domain
MNRPSRPIDPERHFQATVPGEDFPGLPEGPMAVRNVGWSLGNYCPNQCRHCYSATARRLGADLEEWMVDRVVGQLTDLGVETVNLGGNEPLYTSGPEAARSLLPRVITKLADRRIKVGLTTSGVTIVYLERRHPDILRLLNDVDVSFDSPFAEEHDANRGGRMFPLAARALEICQRERIERSVILCGMRWNFSPRHLDGFLELARAHGANIRVNTLRPVTPEQQAVELSPRQFYEGFGRLLAGTRQVDLGDPLLAAVTGFAGAGCPCGRSSFRIHSVTPAGTMPISPCIYVHDYKAGDLLTQDVQTILASPQFRAFRRRQANPDRIEGCAGCRWLQVCRGGCAARAFFSHLYRTGERSLCARDPYCPARFAESASASLPSFPRVTEVDDRQSLVHRDYLCTWIGRPS